MRHHPARAVRAAVGIATVALVAAVAPTGGAAVPAPGPGAAAATRAATSPEKRPDYDARRAGHERLPHDARVLARPSAGVRALRRDLGVQGRVQIDPLTRTPRIVARLDGYLTARSAAPARSIALGYVRSHPDVFRLSAREVSGLVLRRSYVDTTGTRHLSFVQQVRGIPVFGNGLRAHVARDGRLLQLDGSPLARLPRTVGSPRIGAVQARDLAIHDVGGRAASEGVVSRSGPDQRSSFRNGDDARLVLFQTGSGLRLGWQTITMSTGYQHVIDARGGKVLYRRNLVQSDTGDVWQNYPGAARGGTATTVDLTAPGWLPKNAPKLDGNVAHVWTDVNDDDRANPAEEVAPSSKNSFRYSLVPFRPAACVTGFTCTWDPEVPGSWQANRAQNAVQLFAFLGRFHDHLAASPIGFTRAAGNFEAVDHDAVQGQAMDGAAGGPDGAHVDNANMSTPPDGIPPVMQMYLFHEPGLSFPDEDPFLAGNSGDEADVVYHEYTHGLSNRLVVDAGGNSTLNSNQGGAMGEAWSDWYAMDYLVAQGLFTDTKTPGEIRIGQYVGWGNNLIRTQPLDCPVGSKQPKSCPGTPTAGAGGYTYGDFGRIAAGPEVHADGEIWGETLWDLRVALGSSLTESLVTRAMELSPADPSFLDMRNSILQADLVVRGGADQAIIWQVFAGRGMGFFAASDGAGDNTPVEDFSIPPTTTARGTLTGVVQDVASGAPIAGAVVLFGGHASGFGGDYAAVSDGSGRYTISGIVPGTYAEVSARGPNGYDPLVRTVTIAAGTQSLDWALRRDWASSAAGGTISSFAPPDYSAFGCGPRELIDQSQSSGWGSDAPFADGLVKPIVIGLPVPIDVAEIDVNPANTCGDPGSASTGDYRLETSPDGVTWTVQSQGHFGIADRVYHSVPLTGGDLIDVRFVRYTMIDTQVVDLGGDCNETPDAFAGCEFMDSTELGVYGTP